MCVYHTSIYQYIIILIIQQRLYRQLKIRTCCILRLLVNNNFTQSSTRVRVNCSLPYW